MIDFAIQRKRSDLFMTVRKYFLEKGYLEADTPSLSPSLIPEPTIDTFKAKFISEFVGERDLYLIPSPEIFMKKMLAEGSGSLFQISKCFRNAEQIGREHNPEFTMLEYYTVGYDERDSIPLTIDMIRETNVGSEEWVSAEPLLMTMEEAAREYAEVRLRDVQNEEKIKAEAQRLGLDVPPNEKWEDTFNRIFLSFVEPSLPHGRMVFLLDYPEQIECLAKRKKGTPYRKRWEMYVNGVEIANCYDEETDKEEIEGLMRKAQERIESERKGSGRTISLMDEELLSLRLPSSSGVAIGMDRLLQMEEGKKSMAEVLSFPLF